MLTNNNAVPRIAIIEAATYNITELIGFFRLISSPIYLAYFVFIYKGGTFNIIILTY